MTRFTGLADMDAPYSMFEGKDGSLRLFASAAPIPGGRGWPREYPRWLMLLMRSLDKGLTWSTVSVIGSNDYDMDEGTIAYLPDGSLGFFCRPTSAWFQSYDDGRTWSPPRLLLTDPIIEDPNFGSEFLGPKLLRRGDVVTTPGGVTAVVFGGRHKLESDDPKVPNNGEVIYSRDNGRTWVKPAPGRGFKCDPKSYYPNACVLEDGSIFMVGQREGFKNRFGPHGAEVTSVRFRIKKPEEGEGVRLLPIGEPS
ncbi:MAG: sialidase family protein [Acidobacteriota bacterium]|nr:sialidase family protein [Acidobacteriota bacterium]